MCELAVFSDISQFLFALKSTLVGFVCLFFPIPMWLFIYYSPFLYLFLWSFYQGAYLWYILPHLYLLKVHKLCKYMWRVPQMCVQDRLEGSASQVI